MKKRNYYAKCAAHCIDDVRKKSIWMRFLVFVFLFDFSESGLFAGFSPLVAVLYDPLVISSRVALGRRDSLLYNYNARIDIFCFHSTILLVFALPASSLLI